ncbi:MFS transporter [Gordonibacter sp.]|uniref:MFS transporter n=1 Tax=Gordonibacter sp. TaxID=1968902 RepID=UPI002FCB8CE8
MNHRMRYLAAGVLSLLFLGLIYSWSNFSAPIGQEYGWDRESMRLVFTVSIIGFCAGGLLGARLNKKLSFKPALLIAGALLVGGFASTALLIDTGGLLLLYVSYGVLCGGGCGIAYNVIISTVNAWFPDRIGFSSGALMMGFGLGGLILGTAAAAGIDMVGWKAVFLVLATLIALVIGVTALVIKPKGRAQAASAKASAMERPPATRVDRREGGSVKVIAGESASAARSPLFWIYCIWATCALCAGLIIIGDAKPAALAVGLEAGFATLLVGLVSTTNGLARIVIGMVYDRCGLRLVVAISSLSALAGALALALSFAPGMQVPLLFVAGALLVGFSYGCIPVISSAFTLGQYGPGRYPENLALANFTMAPAAVLSSLAAASARDVGGAANGDFAVYVVVAVIALLALGVFVVFARRLGREESGRAAGDAFEASKR